MNNFKYHLLFFSLSLLFFKCYSQNNINPEWLITSYVDKWGVVSDQVTDENGMIYLTGNFTSSFGLGNSSEKLTGNNCIFIAKVKPSGSVVWIKEITCSQYCSSNSIIVGNNGSVYLCGNYQGEINENNVLLNSKEKKNAFIVKFDNKGKIECGTSINGQFRNKHMFLSQDKKGNLIFAGSYYGELFFNNSHFDSRYYCEIAILKINDKGVITGSLILEGKADDLVNDLYVTGNNEIILTGSFEKELLIHQQNLLSNGQKDIFLIRLDENLRLIQASQFGGVYDDIGNVVKLDKNNNLLLAATFTDRLQFNKSHLLESNGKCDVFLSKFDGTGQLMWSKSFGGAANDYVNSMDINNSNDIYLIGSYHGTLENGSDKIESENFSTDIFLVKYNKNGDVQFIESFGGENDDFGRAICLDNSNNIFVNGNYSKSIKLLGIKSKEHESEDFFVSRLYECETTKRLLLPDDTTIFAKQFLLSVVDDFERYFWNGQPGTNKLLIDSSGCYVVEVIDKHQCLSSDTIFVRLNKPPEFDLGGPYSLLRGETIKLNAPESMKEYLWSDHTTLSYLIVKTSGLDPGTYSFWVEMTDENGCKIKASAIVKINDFNKNLITSAIESNRLEMTAEISPNPARDALFIHIGNLDLMEKVKMELFSLEAVIFWGSEFVATTINADIEANLSRVPPGTYFLIIRNGNNEIRKKVVIL